MLSGPYSAKNYAGIIDTSLQGSFELGRLREGSRYYIMNLVSTEQATAMPMMLLRGGRDN